LCQEEEPCFSSIQAAIDQALPGDHIQIQPGVYHEQLSIWAKNVFIGSNETNRIVIGRAEGAPVDSVILEGTDSNGGFCVGAIQIAKSERITISGLVITGFAGPAIRLRGGRNENAAIHIENNRIFDNGSDVCNGGIVIENGNPDTLVVNNLIYANGGNGIKLSRSPGPGRGGPSRPRGKRQAGGPHYLIENTIHGNGKSGVALSQNQSAFLANNAITGNGVSRRNRGEGYGVSRDESRRANGVQLSMLNNLLCGNVFGETNGPVFEGNHADNLTPTGVEDVSVLASPECVPPEGVYQNMQGADGLSGTLDDDFTLTGPSGDGMPSPAIDRGLNLGTLGQLEAFTPVLEADFRGPYVRPTQRDINRPLDFDIGALELPCSCDGCESCEIVINENRTSADYCMENYDSATQCCNRLTSTISEKELGQAFDVCPDTRSQRPGWDPKVSADGCSGGVPDHLVLCPEVRLGCDYDAGEANCPKGIDLPCNNHDYCYQTCGVPKEDCDVAFYWDIIDVCNNMTIAQKLLCYDDCVATATTYYDGVAIGAASAYAHGQNRSCQCCQDVFFAP